MADIVRLKDHFEHKPSKRPAKAVQARILMFTGVRYVPREPVLLGASLLTGKRPVHETLPYEG